MAETDKNHIKYTDTDLHLQKYVDPRLRIHGAKNQPKTVNFFALKLQI